MKKSRSTPDLVNGEHFRKKKVSAHYRRNDGAGYYNIELYGEPVVSVAGLHGALTGRL